MSTVVHTLTGEDWHSLHRYCLGVYLDGECYAFAIALHRGLGWPIIGLINRREIRHAAVQNPDGTLFDVRGEVAEEEFGRPFGIHAPYNIREVTEDELNRDGEPLEAREHSIASARRLAEALWPDLGWERSLQARVAAFADALEALSRHHRLWIRHSSPTAPPMIAIGEDDEGGYVLDQTADGLTFSIDRYFPGQQF